jgi:hypothetical protein
MVEVDGSLNIPTQCCTIDINALIGKAAFSGGADYISAGKSALADQPKSLNSHQNRDARAASLSVVECPTCFAGLCTARCPERCPHLSP